MTDSLEGMISRRFTATLRVVALAPLLLVAVYLPGQMMLRCRMDGLIRATCCCPAAVEERGPSTPALKAQDCCEHQSSVAARPPVEAPAVAAGDLMAPAPSGILSLAPGPLALDGSARANRRWQANGPPGDRPPIVLLKHAFLI